MDGFINILKPPGMTSHDVVSYIRRLLKTKKVGHTGTLDPGVAGVLLLCIGKATRLIEYLDKTKSYRAEITFGAISSSGDSSGKIEESEGPIKLSEEQVINVLSLFRGEISQIPPMTSAVHYQGKKLYELARQGIEVERQPRKAIIHSLEISKWYDDDRPRAILDISCSAGTYIRTLCQDIGAQLGCGAYMSFLLRTGVGDNNIEQAITLEELGASNASGANFFKSIEDTMSFLPIIEIWDGALKSVSSGGILFFPGVKSVSVIPKDDQPVLLMYQGKAIGIGRALLDNDQVSFKPEKIII
ncbi:MAG: tRNA pseudouridine(55) synthase TruB [Peptococcaceae bacterium]|nr:tRNA pseudouridine(55) synthase TruB [Peptococcaceae bacterium]